VLDHFVAPFVACHNERGEIAAAKSAGNASAGSLQLSRSVALHATAMPYGCLSAIAARKKSPADAMREEARADHAVAFEDSEAANS
jgi:hypothetical protein